MLKKILRKLLTITCIIMLSSCTQMFRTDCVAWEEKTYMVRYCEQVEPPNCWRNGFGGMSCGGGGGCRSYSSRPEKTRICTKSVCKAGYIKTQEGCFTEAEIAEMKSAPCESGQERKSGECATIVQAISPNQTAKNPPEPTPKDKVAPSAPKVEKIGFIDRKGNIVVPAIYEIAREYSEGRAVVGTMVYGKYPVSYCWHEVIDKSGNSLYSEGCPHHSRFGSGLLPASVQQFGKVGYLDKTGHFAIPARYVGGSEFHEGLASISIVNKSAKYFCGYIDPSGNEIIVPDRYVMCGSFSGGLAAVAEKANGKVGYIKKNGALHIPLKFDLGGVFGDGLAYVTEGDKAGFINSEGQFVISPSSSLKQKANHFPVFSEGVAAIFTSSSSAGFIDKSGSLVIPPVYSNAGRFDEGLAPAAVRQPDGKDLWGYIRKDGTWAIKPQFFVATPFHEGVAAVGVLTSKW